MPSAEAPIKKMRCMHTMGRGSVIEENEATPFAASWTDLEIVILSKASRTERRDIAWHPLSVDPKQK